MITALTAGRRAAPARRQSVSVSRSWSDSLSLSRLVVLTAAALAGGLGCSQQTVVLPSRNFDRPTDMTFACLGIFTQDGVVTRVTGQPMARCHPSGIFDRKPMFKDEAGTEFRTYAFVPNAARGDLSVVNMSHCRADDTACHPLGAKIVDLDPDSVGYGAAPLGELPEVISASQDGCRLVTANRGSCDLSLVNPALLLEPSITSPQRSPSGTGTLSNAYVRTIVPSTASGRLLQVAPGEIAFVPQQTNQATPADPGDQGDPGLCVPRNDRGVEGTLAAPVGAPPATLQAPATWRAVVTFPSCDLVALIDLPSGDILDSFQVGATAAGFSYVHSGREPVCPVNDCGPGAGPDRSADGSVSGDDPDGGPSADDGPDGNTIDTAAADAADAASGDTLDGPPSDDDSGVDAGTPTAALALPGGASLRVSALALHPEGHRVYFGAVNSPFIGALDITGAADALAEPTVGASTRLQGDRVGGVTRLRVSVDPYAFSKAHDDGVRTRAEYGRFVAGRHDKQPTDPLEFLYAVARDASLRVIDIGRSAPFECDLWIDAADPKALATDGDDTIRPACFPYRAAGVDGPRRFQYAGPPGLRFGSPVQDIAFANYRTPPLNSTATPPLDEQVLNGAFAFVLTAAGSVHILNIDPELRMPGQVIRNADGTIDMGPSAESPKPLTHSVRDANVVTFSSVLGPQNGPPRLDAPPIGPVDGPTLKIFSAYETRLNARIVPQAGRTTPVPEDTYVYFPNRTNVTAQAWNLVWEGDLTGVRGTGDIEEKSGAGSPLLPVGTPPLDTHITDNGRGFCGPAVDGDVLTLTGCETDAGCPPGAVCVHSTHSQATIGGHPIPGMCFRRDKAAEFRDNEQCGRMLDTPRRYEIVSSTDKVSVVIPKRAEVHRPVHMEGGLRVGCNVTPSVIDPALPPDPYWCRDPRLTTNDVFKCVSVTARPNGTAIGIPLGPNDLTRRCLIPCDTDQNCGQGRLCLDFRGPDGKFCADAAPIARQCGFDELFSYKLGAAGAFVVTGTAIGRPDAVTKVDGPMGPVCVVNPALPPSRIPMNGSACAPAIVSAFQDAQASEGADPGATARWLGDNRPSPEPCFIAESAETSPKISAFFENGELRFLLTDLQKTIADTLQVRFEVHGGVAPQLVATSIDALPGVPARILLGPIPQPDQPGPGPIPMGECVAGTDCGVWSDLPYLFVVDQRQLVSNRGAVGVRGQILRLSPRIDPTVPVAGFEGFTASGRYFPVQ